MSDASSSRKDRFGPAGPFGRVFQIIPGVQNYDWGITGKDGSLVAIYAQATEQLKMKIEEKRPYAELWMGTHPTLPSTIIPPPGAPQPPSNGTSPSFISLSSYLNRHPSLLGDRVVEKYGTGITRSRGKTSSSDDGKQKDVGALPFLFKVLSAGKALSIQAHPDKKLAERLHAEKPKSYKDDNHKPEMAIALTPFRGFCGFRPLQEIVHFLDVVPEFRELVRPSDVFLSQVTYASSPKSASTEEERKEYLRQIFSPLMKAAMTDVKKRTMGIAQRYRAKLSAGEAGDLEVSEELAQLVCKLNEQFPGDVGVFCTFVLNLVVLQPGQAIFLGANEPHAYIEGNIIECMAASDNVVRAGLTPKERDVDVLIDMLTYSHAGPEKQLMAPLPWPPLPTSENYHLYEPFLENSTDDNDNDKVKPSKSKGLPKDVASPSGASRGEAGAELPSLLYDPPIEEFSVVMTRLTGGKAERQRPVAGPSLLILTTGRGKLILPSSDVHPEDEKDKDEEKEKEEKEEKSNVDKEQGTHQQQQQQQQQQQPEEEEEGDIIFEMDQPGKVFFVAAHTSVLIRAAEDLPHGENLSVFRAFVEV